jgi:hypothetical protein
MSSGAVRSLLVHSALSMFPQGLRQALLEDKAFLAQSGVTVRTIVGLWAGGPSFQRERLHDGLRLAIADAGSPVAVEDQEGRSWELRAQSSNQELTCTIGAGSSSRVMADVAALSADVAIRTSWFRRVLGECHVEASARAHWLNVLRQAPLSDDAFAELMAELDDSPSRVQRRLRARMDEGRFDLPAVVPATPRYYERLVGKLASAKTVSEYITGGAAPLLADLNQWHGLDGLRFALLTCSGLPISEAIDIRGLERGVVERTYRLLVECGDPVSRVGAIEVALCHLDDYPELGPHVEHLILALVDEDPESDGSGFRLLSSLTVLVAAELTKRGIFRDAPPFYRRQAAIAQASVVVRAIYESGIDRTSVGRWADAIGSGHVYYLQGLLDLRIEPRWLPDFLSADQLHAEFLGRVVNLAIKNEARVQSGSLRALLLDSESVVRRAASGLKPFLPGPLEGAVPGGPPLPDEVLSVIQKNLAEAKHFSARDFAPLTNSGLMFSVPPDLANLAAAALRKVGYSIADVDDEKLGFSVTSGLAVLAAVTRSTDLASAVRVVSRVLRRRKRISLHPNDELRIAMIAAASFEEIDDWARFAGEWINEIAFEASDKEAALTLLVRLRHLVQLEPTLAKHCAAADACIDAFVH